MFFILAKWINDCSMFPVYLITQQMIAICFLVFFNNKLNVTFFFMLFWTKPVIEMLTVPCISNDSEPSRPSPAHFQNHENYDSPMHFWWSWSQSLPSRALSKPRKSWQAYAFLMILRPVAHLPPISKTMRWQSHAFLMILRPLAPLRPTSNQANDDSPKDFFWFWSQPLPSWPLAKPRKP